MKQSLLFKKHAVVAVAVALVMPALAGAQALITLIPQKQVVIIVPNAAAGPSDLLARWISPKLSESIKQNVIVDNKPSANGITAGEFVARASPDGSVLGVGNTGTHAINATLYRRLSYDPVRDFIPVVNVFGAGLVLAANPKLDAKSIRDIIAMAKAKPGSVNVAIAGATGEIATNAIKALAGIDMNNVPYKGGAPAVIAVISGESHFVLTPYGGVNAQVEAGKMKILGTTAANRHVTIATELTFLHITIRHARLGQKCDQRTQESFGLRGRTEIGLGDDFQQRHASPIVIDE